MASGPKTGAERLDELFVGKLRGALQSALIGPGVVIKQLANFFRRHTFPHSLHQELIGEFNVEVDILAARF